MAWRAWALLTVLGCYGCIASSPTDDGTSGLTRAGDGGQISEDSEATAGDAGKDAQSHAGGDASKPPPKPGDPCANVPSTDDGYFCATATKDGFNPKAADGTSVYHCVAGQVAHVQKCTNGCTVEPKGTPDKCR
jgi:hypothetical protein